MGLHPWRRGRYLPSYRLWHNASIRPWVCTHGDFGRTFSLNTLLERFNSAMGLHPWRPEPADVHWSTVPYASIRPWVCTHGDTLRRGSKSCIVTGLQFGHGFAPMETCAVATSCWIRRAGFNSAMGLHPWRRVPCRSLIRGIRTRASIRPWVCTHGDAAGIVVIVVVDHGFNSAMGLHPWRRRQCVTGIF